MRILAKPALRAFWERYPDSGPALKAWYSETAKARWTGPQDIKSRYRSASFVGSHRVVFNIRGNNFRLVVHVRYDIGFVYVRFVGTHDEYDEIDVATV